MTSAMKRSLGAKRIHKERAQPSARKHMGFLEKHKDYVLRAKDFNKKKAQLQKLTERAALRNPDEFHHGMHRAKLVDGVHTYDDPAIPDFLKKKPTGRKGDPKPRGVDESTLALLKTQDRSYVTMKLTTESKKIEKLTQNLGFAMDLEANEAPQDEAEAAGGGGAGGARRRNHIVFVDDEEEVQKADPKSLADRLDTDEALLGSSFRPRREQLRAGAVKKVGTREDAEARLEGYKELELRIEREKKLKLALAQMELANNLSKKGEKTLVKKGTASSAPIYKWKQERK